ncbi:MAG TPA: chemotaxis protein CheD [Clostridiales bacterium UBA8153]|nr:chemotaxis protein CheD [Clostridiales bacterium UBA8153]
MRPEVIPVKMGEIGFSRQGSLACYALGSCVVAILHDRGLGLGGVAHVVLPGAAPPEAPAPGRYAGQAIRRLIEGMVMRGAFLPRCRVYLVGGAQLLDIRYNGLSMGEQNIASARSMLKAHGVMQELREDVGGARGRTVCLEVATGQVTVGRAGQAPEVL